MPKHYSTEAKEILGIFLNRYGQGSAHLTLDAGKEYLCFDPHPFNPAPYDNRLADPYMHNQEEPYRVMLKISAIVEHGTSEFFAMVEKLNDPQFRNNGPLRPNSNKERIKRALVN